MTSTDTPTKVPPARSPDLVADYKRLAELVDQLANGLRTLRACRHTPSYTGDSLVEFLQLRENLRPELLELTERIHVERPLQGFGEGPWFDSLHLVGTRCRRQSSGPQTVELGGRFTVDSVDEILIAAAAAVGDTQNKVVAMLAQNTPISVKAELPESATPPTRRAGKTDEERSVLRAMYDKRGKTMTRNGVATRAQLSDGATSKALRDLIACGDVVRVGKRKGFALTDPQGLKSAAGEVARFDKAVGRAR